MINRFIVYMVIFMIEIPLCIVHYCSKRLLKRDPESPILMKIKEKFKSWAYFGFPMWYFYFTVFDVMLVAGLNIKIFVNEKHIWSHYMEASFILSCLVLLSLILFCCFIPCLLKWQKVQKKGLSSSFNAASKGLNQKRKFAYFAYFSFWFGGRIIFTILILIGGVFSDLV